MNYRREIDGLRALAVLPVILFHAGVPGFSGGYVGVDVFFVISGYLITSLILGELAENRFSLADFYARRARRILPALATVVLVCVPFAWLWMMPSQFTDFAQSIAAVALFSANLLFWSEDGYFAAAAEEKPLLHTWSLAVEEQYYLIFPLLMLLGWRYALSWLPLLIAVLAAASLIAAEWAVEALGSGRFYLPQLRVWELMIGSLTAFYPHKRSLLGGAAGNLLGIAGLFAMAYAMNQFDADTPFPSAWVLIPTLGTALIILCATPVSWLGRLLARRELVGIGLISYSAYLWHHPLFAFARIRSREDPNEWLLVGLGVLSLGLAWLSWRFVERPCRSPIRLPQRRALAMGATVSAVLLAIGIAGHIADGLPQRLNETQRIEYKRLKQALDPSRFDDKACRFGSENIDDKFMRRFDACADQHGSAVLVTGDSHATDLFNALAKNATVPFVVSVSQGWCRVHNPPSWCHYGDVEKLLAERGEQIRALIYTQKGSYFLRGYQSLPINEEYIGQVQAWLRRLDYSGEVIWLGPQMEPQLDLRNLNAMVHSVEPADAALELTLLNEVDEFLIASNRAAGINYLSKIALTDYQFERDFLIEGKYSFSDGDHWSPSGERVFGGRLLRDPMLARLLGANALSAAD